MDVIHNKHDSDARAATAECEAQEAIATIPFPMDEQLAVCAKEQMDWDNKNDQALGIITLKISHSLHTHITDETSVIWESLATMFATPGPAADKLAAEVALETLVGIP